MPPAGKADADATSLTTYAYALSAAGVISANACGTAGVTLMTQYAGGGRPDQRVRFGLARGGAGPGQSTTTRSPWLGWPKSVRTRCLANLQSYARPAQAEADGMPQP